MRCMKSKIIVKAVPALPRTDACIRQTVNTIKNRLKYKYHFLLEAGFDFEGAADIAVCYALTPGLTGRGPFPKSPNDLQALAWTKAKWLANDEIRRRHETELGCLLHISRQAQWTPVEAP